MWCVVLCAVCTLIQSLKVNQVKQCIAKAKLSAISVETDSKCITGNCGKSIHYGNLSPSRIGESIALGGVPSTTLA